MQTSLYAFVPFGILAAIALIATGVALWPGRRRSGLIGAPPLVKTPRSSAEILHFPSRASQFPAVNAARMRHGNR